MATGRRRPGGVEGARSEGGAPTSLAGLAEVRESAYGLYGALFLYPTEERTGLLAAAAPELRRAGEAARVFSFFASLRSVLDSLERLAPDDRAMLEEEHVALFHAGGPSVTCPPYESAYRDRTGFARGSVAVDVERAYAESGAAVSALAAGELPDHVSLELEFMSLLCAAEAEAWAAADEHAAERFLRREETFLGQHLLRWFPTFARTVRQAASDSSFYRRVADAAHVFLVHDLDLVGVLAAGRSSAPAVGRR